jgi:hypothetical protein
MKREQKLEEIFKIYISNIKTVNNKQNKPIEELCNEAEIALDLHIVRRSASEWWNNRTLGERYDLAKKYKYDAYEKPTSELVERVWRSETQ